MDIFRQSDKKSNFIPSSLSVLVNTNTNIFVYHQIVDRRTLLNTDLYVCQLPHLNLSWSGECLKSRLLITNLDARHYNPELLSSKASCTQLVWHFGTPQNTFCSISDKNAQGRSLLMNFVTVHIHVYCCPVMYNDWCTMTTHQSNRIYTYLAGYSH